MRRYNMLYFLVAGRIQQDQLLLKLDHLKAIKNATSHPHENHDAVAALDAVNSATHPSSTQGANLITTDVVKGKCDEHADSAFLSHYLRAGLRYDSK